MRSCGSAWAWRVAVLSYSQVRGRSCRWELQTLVKSADDEVARELKDLHHRHHEADGEDHHIGLVTVVAVANREVADPAAADDAGHRGVAQEAHGDDRDAVRDARA